MCCMCWPAASLSIRCLAFTQDHLGRAGGAQGELQRCARVPVGTRRAVKRGALGQPGSQPSLPREPRVLLQGRSAPRHAGRQAPGLWRQAAAQHATTGGHRPQLAVPTRLAATCQLPAAVVRWQRRSFWRWQLHLRSNRPQHGAAVHRLSRCSACGSLGGGSRLPGGACALALGRPVRWLGTPFAQWACRRLRLWLRLRSRLLRRHRCNGAVPGQQEVVRALGGSLCAGAHHACLSGMVCAQGAGPDRHSGDVAGTPTSQAQARLACRARQAARAAQQAGQPWVPCCAGSSCMVPEAPVICRSRGSRTWSRLGTHSASAGASCVVLR